MPPEAVPNAAPAAAPAATPAAPATPSSEPKRSTGPKPVNSAPIPLRDAPPPTKVVKEAPRAPMAAKELAAKLRAELLRDSAGKFLGRSEPSNDNAETPAAAPAAEPETPAEAPAEVEAEAATEQTPEPAEEKPEEPKAEPEPEKKPEEKKEAEKKADALSALERARAAQKLARIEGQLLEHKASAEKATARVSELEAQLKTYEEARKDINKLLALGEVGHEKLADMFVKGELNFEPTAPTPPEPPKPQRTPEEQEMYEFFKAHKEREAQQAVERARLENAKTVRSAIDQGSTDWPVLAALPNSEHVVLNAIMQHAEAHGGEEPDFATVARQMNAAMTADVEALLGNEAMKKWVIEKLGLQTPAAATAPAPAPSKAAAAAEAPKPKAAPVAAPTLTAKNSGAIPSREPKGRIATTSEMLARIKQMQGGA